MRNLILTFALSLLVFASCNIPIATGRNGTVFKSATEYNDYIIHRQYELTKYFNEYSEAAGVSKDSAMMILTKASEEADVMVDDIAAMSDFKGDTTFKKAALNIFLFYQRILKDDYVRLLEINSKEEATDDDILSAAQIVEKVSSDEELLDKRIHNAQRDFASKYGLRLEKQQQLSEE